jgi:hypothetical protein
MFAPPVVKPKSAPPQRPAAAAAQRQLLQRTIGNQATLRLLAQRGGATSAAPGPIQAKLNIGAVNDPLEHEADRVANQVMRMPAPDVSVTAAPPQLSRKCAECEEEKLQRKSDGLAEASSSEAPASVHEVLRSPGQPLDAATRAYMEPRFGHDFSGVHIHLDASAAATASALGARAYTVGTHIVFAPGQYRPRDPAGLRLLGHELAHTVQQRGSGPSPGPAQEQDAEAASGTVQAGGRPQLREPSRVGFAAQPQLGHLGRLHQGPEPGDGLLGLEIVTRSEIEAKIRRIMKKPGSQAREGRADFNASPVRAKANLYHTHFRDDEDRLSYALGVFEQYLGVRGESVELFEMLLTYEVQMAGGKADLIVHDPPTEAENQRLGELRQKRRAELAQREAARARVEPKPANVEAKPAHQEPEDLLGCPSPKTARIAPGAYSNQGIVLPYDKLVPEPDPTKGFDQAEGQRVLKDTRRFEQLYYDALSGNGRAAWFVCQLEVGAREHVGRRDARELHDLDCTFVHNCGYNPEREGFSAQTASGQRIRMVIAEAFADEAFKIRLARGVIGDALNLWVGGKVASGILAKSTATTGTASSQVPAATDVPASATGEGISAEKAQIGPIASPPPVKPAAPVPNSKVASPDPEVTEPASPSPHTGDITPPASGHDPVAVDVEPAKPTRSRPPQETAEKPKPPKDDKPAADTAQKPGSVREDPQRGVKEALKRVKAEIAADQAEIAAHNKEINEVAGKVFDLRKELNATERSDPNRARTLKDFQAETERLKELRDRQAHREAINKTNRETESRLQKALDQKTYDRPEFRQGIREKVWENALKEGKGKVVSPSGEEVRNFNDPWEMGHKPKYEFRKHVQSAAERGISRDQFIEEYNDAGQYRPETPKDNASHRYEDKTDAYLGP